MPQPHVHLDFETRSLVDLKACGAYVYASDPSTRVLCVAYAVDDGPVSLWAPTLDVPFPDELCELAERKDVQFWAHSAQFERLIWSYVVENDYDAPPIGLGRWVCTAAMARVNGLPGALDDATRAVDARQKKSFAGANLIRKLCVPRPDGTFNNSRKLLRELYDYCKQDVRAERELAKTLRAMTPGELADYRVSEKINDRGIFVDLPLCRGAIEYALEEQEDLQELVEDLTEGAVVKVRGPKLTKWVYERLDDETKPLMHTYKKGEQRLTLDKTVRARLLDVVPPGSTVWDVIDASDAAQAASTGKYKAMAFGADPDDSRVRGVFMFSGAVSTGRFSGRRIQPQNFPREGLDNPDEVRGLIVDDYDPRDIVEASGLNMMQTLKRLLRYAIQAEPGKVLVAGDWSAIEGRALPWLAKDEDAEAKLQLFRDGVDVYVRTAARIYGTKVSRVTKEQRQIGKVAELALGYGGGVGAFQAMGRGYGVQVTDEEAERIKRVWRASNPWAEQFWDDLHWAACAAVHEPGTQYVAGRVWYEYKPDFLGGSLLCGLPSGRMLTYPKAQVDVVQGPHGTEFELSALKAAWKPKADETEWPRVRLWRGLLAENITQAACADLLRDTLLALETHGVTIGHVHDEIILEVPEAESAKWEATLERAMLCPNPWANGLPLAAEVWSGAHYRK